MIGTFCLVSSGGHGVHPLRHVLPSQTGWTREQRGHCPRAARHPLIRLWTFLIFTCANAPPAPPRGARRKMSTLSNVHPAPVADRQNWMFESTNRNGTEGLEVR